MKKQFFSILLLLGCHTINTAPSKSNIATQTKKNSENTESIEAQGLLVILMTQKTVQHLQLRLDGIRTNISTFENDPRIHIFTENKLSGPEDILEILKTLHPLTCTNLFETLVSSLLIARANAFESITRSILTITSDNSNNVVTTIKDLNAFADSELSRIAKVNPDYAKKIRSESELYFVNTLTAMNTTITNFDNHFKALKPKVSEYIANKFTFANTLDSSFIENSKTTRKTVDTSITKGLNNIEQAIAILKSEYAKLVSLQPKTVQSKLQKNVAQSI